MSNFVYDNTSLAYPKTNLFPLGGADHNKYIIDTDWNSAMQASVDLRGAIVNGKFFGFSPQSSDPDPAGFTTSWIWVRNSDGQLIHVRPDGSSRSLADKDSDFLPDVDNVYRIGNSSFRWISAAISTIVSQVVSVTNATTTNYIELGSGDTVGVSNANQGRIRYNTGTQIFEVSVNGGAYAPLSGGGGGTTYPELAAWSTSTVRHILVSDTQGNDANPGFIDAAPNTNLTASVATIAVKTIARAMQVIATVGLGRHIEVIVEAATYSSADVVLSLNSFASFLWRGTRTVSSAGCTAFDGSTADHKSCGGTIAAGTNSAGYKATFSSKTVSGATAANPIVITSVAHGFATGDWVLIDGVGGVYAANGYHKITVVDSNNFQLNNSIGAGSLAFNSASAGTAKRWKIVKADNTAPGFTDEETSKTLHGLRMRFDSSSGIPNTISNIIALGVDTIIPSTELTGLSSSDVFYIESPGVSLARIGLSGPAASNFVGFADGSTHTSALRGSIRLTGFTCTTLNVEGIDSAVLAFVQAGNSFLSTSCSSLTLASSYADSSAPTGTSVSVGGCRFLGFLTFAHTSRLSLNVVSHLPTTGTSCDITHCYGDIISGCVFNAGLRLIGCGGTGASGDIQYTSNGAFLIGSANNAPGNTFHSNRITGLPSQSSGTAIATSGLTIAYSSVILNGLDVIHGSLNTQTPAVAITGNGCSVTAMQVTGSNGNQYGIGFVTGVDLGTSSFQTPSRNNRLHLQSSLSSAGDYSVCSVRGAVGDIEFGNDLGFNASGFPYSEFNLAAVGRVEDAYGNAVTTYGAAVSLAAGTVTGGSAALNNTQMYANDPSSPAALSAYRIVRGTQRADSRKRRVVLAQADTAGHATGIVGVTVTSTPTQAAAIVSCVGTPVWVKFDRSGAHPAPTVTEPPVIAYLSQDTAGLAQADAPNVALQVVPLGPIVAIHPADGNTALVHLTLGATAVASGTAVDLDSFARNESYASLFTDGTTTYDRDWNADPRPIAGLTKAGKLTLSLGTLNITVGPGAGYAAIGASDFKAFSWPSTPKTLTATSGNPRIDLILANNATEPATIDYLTGTAGATPQPPAVPAGKTALFEIYVPPSTSTVDGMFFYRRLNRRVSFPLSQMWGVLQGCNPNWSAATLTQSATWSPRSEINSVIIDGEVLQGNGILRAEDDSIHPPTNTSGILLKPFYIYACGGRHNPLSGDGNISGSYVTDPAAIAVVFSTTTPDMNLGCASAALNIASFGARGAINRMGCTYIGIGYTRNDSGTTRKVHVAYQGDWVYGCGEPLNGTNGLTFSDGNTLDLTLQNPPAPSSAVLAIPQFDQTMGNVNEVCHLELQPENGLTVGYSNAGPAQGTIIRLSGTGNIISVAAGIIPIASNAGAKIRAAASFDSGGSELAHANAVAYNMNVPRLTLAGQMGPSLFT